MSNGVNAQGSSFPVELAVRHICVQHRNLARTLKALEKQGATVSESPHEADAQLIAAALRYIRIFPERHHHPAEEEFLFAAMHRAGAPREMIERVEGDHREGAEKFDALCRAFEAWRRDPGPSCAPFLECLSGYSRLTYDHMRYEEEVVLPAAVELLQARDWAAIAHAFEAHVDPLFGSDPDVELAPLRRLLAA